MIVCRGTSGTFLIGREWLSDYNVIEGSPFHYGFYTAASDVAQDFADYMNSHLEDGLTTANCKVWVTGHSRGAAVANLLAGHFLPNMNFDDEDVYAYTFACPNVSMDQDLPTRNNIFNYNIGGDLVPRVPLEVWGYSRYGKTTTLNNGDYISGINVIDENSMDEFIAYLSVLSSREQVQFMQSVHQSLSDMGVGDGVSNATFIVGSLLKAIIVNGYQTCLHNPLNGIRDGLNLAEVVIDIFNTHKPSTYEKWITSMI